MFRTLFLFVFLILPAFSPLQGEVDTSWVRRYNETGGTAEYGADVAVDRHGNVYVTGTQTIKYDPPGNLQWVGQWGGSGVAIDSLDNVYVSGTGTQDTIWPYNYDYLTVKYYPNGDTAWLRWFSGPVDGSDFVFAMTADQGGNVYVAGECPAGATSTDIFTVKYYSNGDTAWVRSYNGPGNDWDRPYAIAVDALGNVCVTGYSRGIGTNADFITIKYYPNGDTAWVRRFAGEYWDEGRAIAIDELGSVYVTGLTGVYQVGLSPLTIKYAADGTELWTSPYGTGDVAVDAAHNVLLIQRFQSSGYTTIKLHPVGDTAWTREYHGPNNELNVAMELAVDDFGSSYVTGYGYYQFAEDDTVTDYATVKYDENGNLVWLHRYDGTGHGEDDAAGIVVDDSGNSYVTGGSLGSDSSWDFATIKYSPAPFTCGDVNNSGIINIADEVYLIQYIFAAGPAPDPIESGDVNCNGIVNIADAVYLIQYIFSGGPPPCDGC